MARFTDKIRLYLFLASEKCVVPSMPLDVKNKYNLILSRKQDQRPVLQIILEHIYFWHLEGLLLTSMSLDAKNKYNLILSTKQHPYSAFVRLMKSPEGPEDEEEKEKEEDKEYTPSESGSSSSSEHSEGEIAESARDLATLLVEAQQHQPKPQPKPQPPPAPPAIPPR